MPKPPKSGTVRPGDVLGVGRLAVAATSGVTQIAHQVHRTIDPGPTGDFASLVYTTIRAVTQLSGTAMDALLGPAALAEPGPFSPKREAMVAALNGVIGDYLVATGNPLAISMGLSQDSLGQIPTPTGKIVLLLHGLCLNDLQWTRKGHNHGAALAADLGYTPVFLRYNSGLHISDNGRALAEVLEILAAKWPLPLDQVAMVGHSMGGLVARSAYYYGTLAGHEWTKRVRKLVFLGTPHHGAPLERLGNFVNTTLDHNPYTAPFAGLGRIRSAGITDLRYGNVVEEDWAGRDRFENSADCRRAVPLPEDVECFAMAAAQKGHGDGFVPVNSALGVHEDPQRCLAIPVSHQWTAAGIRHLDLLSSRDVYAKMRAWLRAG